MEPLTAITDRPFSRKTYTHAAQLTSPGPQPFTRANTPKHPGPWNYHPGRRVGGEDAPDCEKLRCGNELPVLVWFKTNHGQIHAGEVKLDDFTISP